MSKSSWERAFGIADSSYGDSVSGNELTARQREIQQEVWDKDLGNAREQSKAEAETKASCYEDKDDSLNSWADLYKSEPAEESIMEIELSAEDSIIAELERSGHFNKTVGVVGSVKSLIQELDSTRRQLQSIKQALG